MAVLHSHLAKGCALALLAAAPVLYGAVTAAQQVVGPSASDLLVAGRSFEQPQLSAYPLEVPAGLGVEILPVSGSVFMIARPAGNVVV